MLWLVVASVAGVYYVAVKGEDRSAFNRWQPIVADLVAGEDVYYKNAFPTPPIMGLILYPFTLLPGAAAMAAWFAFKVLTTGAVFWWLLTAVPGSHRLSVTAGVAVFAVVSRPLLGDLLHGNVNLWILFLIVAAAMAYSRHHDVTAGLCLSLAIACKLTPALLLVYFLVKRAWRLCISATTGLLLWLVVVPGSILGFSHNWMLLDHWADMMVWPYVSDGQVDTEQVNQSLPGLLYRLGTDSVAIKAEDGRPDVSVNLLSLSSSQMEWLNRLVTFGLVGGMLWMVRRPLPERGCPGFWHELGVVLLVMLLVSERSWKHHYVTLTPCVIALAAFASGFTDRGSWQRWLVYGCIALAALAMALTSNDLARPLFGVHGAKLSQAYGAYVWAAFALLSAHLYVLRHLRLLNAESMS